MENELLELKLKYPNRNVDEFHNYVERHCIQCGKEFLLEFITEILIQKQYCSDTCRLKATALARKNRKQAERQLHNNCTVCGKSMQQTEFGKIKRYCSDACKQAAYRNRKINKQVL
jgi:predicted nucleic acid-binding Zn ribbon protein